VTPLPLADGRVVDTSTGLIATKAKDDFIEVPTNQDIIDRELAVKRRLADLPAPPEEMNTVAIVASYYLFGLDNNDIAIATGLNVQQVEKILSLDQFTSMFKQMTQSILELEKSNVEVMLTQHSAHAVKHRCKLI
jgi:hypothetical protein